MYKKLGIMLYVLAASLGAGLFYGNAGYVQCARRGDDVHPAFKKRGKRKRAIALKNGRRKNKRRKKWKQEKREGENKNRLLSCAR